MLLDTPSLPIWFGETRTRHQQIQHEQQPEQSYHAGIWHHRCVLLLQDRRLGSLLSRFRFLLFLRGLGSVTATEIVCGTHASHELRFLRTELLL